MKARGSRVGRAIDSLVLGTVFFILLPIWLLGNLFVAVFPAKSTPLVALDKQHANVIATSQPSTQSPTLDTPLLDDLSDASPTSEATANRSPAVPESRVWTRRADGKTVQATLLRVAGDQVHLLTADGRELPVPLDVFADADHEYVQQYR